MAATTSRRCVTVQSIFCTTIVIAALIAVVVLYYSPTEAVVRGEIGASTAGQIILSDYSLLEMCKTSAHLGIEDARDAACYFAHEEALKKAVSADAGATHAVWCGSRQEPLVRPTPAVVILSSPPTEPVCDRPIFHTYDSGRGSEAGHLAWLVASFLATQCCSAELWVWTTVGDPAALLQAEGAVIPPGHEGRVKVLQASGVFVPLRLLKQYGGTYVSVDTILLRDFSPLFVHETAFFYRWAREESVAAQVMHAPCDSPILEDGGLGTVNPGAFGSLEKLYEALRIMETSPAYAAHFTLYSSTLFDPLWMRTDGNEPVGLRTKVNPQLRSFSDLFRAGSPGTGSEETFFPGAFALSGHFLDESFTKLPPPGSWVDVLLARFRKATAEKHCTAVPASTAGDAAANEAA